MFDKMMDQEAGAESPKAKMLAKLIEDLMAMPEVAEKAGMQGEGMPEGEIELSIATGKEDEDEVLK